MAIEQILLPGLGESVHEASIINWLVKPGDHVKKYDTLAETVSDKVTTEIPSNFAGVIKAYLVDLDKEVPIGTPIMSIEVEGAASAPEPAAATSSPAAQPASPPAPVPIPAAPSKPSATGGKRFSPAVLALAEEKGVDLNDVIGTGNNGRITRKDVLNYTPSASAPTSAPEPSAPAQATTQVPTAPPASAIPEAPKPAPETINFEPGIHDQIVPADGIRKTIARHMVQSATEIPHAWMLVEADVTNMVKLRNRMKDNFKQQEGISLSYFPFFIKAVVQALKKHPKINTSWQDGNIVYHQDFNISIAVATDDYLYVPVIKHADQLSITGIAKEINRLAQLTRAGKLTSADMADGTFTVNNTGSFGSVASMGIINYPQAAIMQVESINKKLVVTDDGIKIADMVNLCLSLDHRILDGLQAGRFMNDVKLNLSQYNIESDLY
ncbi:2-oxo acid dehydrogenase subunit E2 [Lacticaseibacillus paracasei subsp. tolerans]|nr:dihydrolipoamide acetyltransferase family protein [Lacticaseibacillus paracasei]QUS99283.1 2-oxo acid dehydrogenase subunit E2 [Lacticaseibacillus paracasei subsp. tolerans]